jgi:TRAP-type uncharacterized transport system fused permease subunit
MAVLAAAAQGWLFKRTTWLERSMLTAGGTLMLVPQPLWDAVGIGLALLVVVLQKLRHGGDGAARQT